MIPAFKTISTVVLSIFLFFSCQNKEQNNINLDPSKTLDSVLALSNVQSLEKSLGKQNLMFVDSVVYNSAKNVAGYFYNKGKIDQLIITLDTHGQNLKSVIANTPNSPWHSQGIGIGTNLKTIQAINKKPFVMAGFGWQYGGTILSWEGGNLKDKKLDIIFESPSQNQAKEIAGATDYFSSHEALQTLNPKVKYLAVYLN